MDTRFSRGGDIPGIRRKREREKEREREREREREGGRE